jgi:biotin synthase-related radical SAM superfamily protein
MYMATNTIHVSIGTAAVLGLADLPMITAPTTAYLMVGGRCTRNCAFCAQARGSTASDWALSRVTWPQYPLGEVCARLRAAELEGSLRRCCLQVTAGHNYRRRALEAVRQVRRTLSMPVNVAILIQDAGQGATFLEAGVDRLGFGLDAACEHVFRAVKGRGWARTLTTIEEVARRYPGRASVHLIVGLGESEREMVERIAWAHDLALGVGLFAFTPVRGTALADRAPPSLAVYRRMQAARWLIVRHGARLDAFQFDERGDLAGLGLPGSPDLGPLLGGGEAFCTAGCPDCNRPFYNERPGGPMYNYARPLTPAEARRALDEMALELSAVPAKPGGVAQSGPTTQAGG